MEFIETNTKGVNLNATGKEVNEAVAGTYTVVLNSQPVGGNVNIELSGAPDDDVTMSATQLEFTSTDWNTAQTVTITPTNDDRHGVVERLHPESQRAGRRLHRDGRRRRDESRSWTTKPPQVVVTTTAVTVNEGGSFTYTISLTDGAVIG